MRLAYRQAAGAGEASQRLARSGPSILSSFRPPARVPASGAAAAAAPPPPNEETEARGGGGKRQRICAPPYKPGDAVVLARDGGRGGFQGTVLRVDAAGRRTTVGGRRVDDCSTLLVAVDGAFPTFQISARIREVQLLTEALEEGCFPRWEYAHDKDGWRWYALEESHRIEDAYQRSRKEASSSATEQEQEQEQSSKSTHPPPVQLAGGGKLGRDYEIRFWPSSEQDASPDAAGVSRPGEVVMGAQLSKTSGKHRGIRRRLLCAASVGAQTEDGWALRFGILPPGIVCEFHRMVFGPQRVMSEKQAAQTLGEFVREAEWSALPAGPEGALARLRYRGRHLDAFLQEEKKGGRHHPAVVVWEWFHGGAGREWKAYRGVESSLLEERFLLDAAAAGERHALLNGGKPSSERVAQPLRVLFDVPWTGEAGRIFALHTQVDLLSRRRRGVRREEKTAESKDYIYARWLGKFPRVSAAEVYQVYESFLRAVLKAEETEEDQEGGGTTPGAGLLAAYARAKAEAEARLATSQESQRRFRPPPQDDVPEDFFCPISQGLLLTPAFQKANPATARMEKALLLRWVKEHGNHPLTRAPMTPEDVVEDAELGSRIGDWVSEFV